MKKNQYDVDEQQLNTEAEAEVPEKSKKSKALGTIVNVVLVIAILVAAFATYTSYVSTSGNGVPSFFGLRMFSIQTESVKDPSTLKVGDIITYWTVINGERVLNTHRIEEIYDGGGYLIFETKGDNNGISDSLTVHESEVVGIYSSRIGGLGKVFDYLQTSTGFLIVVVVPVFLFFVFYLIQFFRVLFEYQNVKNRIKYEQERGRTEDLIDEEKRKADEARRAERERIENELREKLRAELSEQAEKPSAAPTEEELAAQKAAEEEKRKAEERAALEAEIREKLRAEMMAEMQKKAEDKTEDKAE